MIKHIKVMINFNKKRHIYRNIWNKSFAEISIVAIEFSASQLASLLSISILYNKLFICKTFGNLF